MTTPKTVWIKRDNAYRVKEKQIYMVDSRFIHTAIQTFYNRPRLHPSTVSKLMVWLEKQKARPRTSAKSKCAFEKLQQCLLTLNTIEAICSFDLRRHPKTNAFGKPVFRKVTPGIQGLYGVNYCGIDSPQSRRVGRCFNHLYFRFDEVDRKYDYRTREEKQLDVFMESLRDSVTKS